MSSRTDALYLADISDSIEAIFKYVDGVSFESFQHDRMRYSAVIREFEIIGEAVGKLSPEIIEKTPQVPWQDIKDFRNLLIHEYFGVDLEIVWSVIFNELAELRQAVVSGQTPP
jgi:uncharacterized protein with HEPN domain